MPGCDNRPAPGMEPSGEGPAALRLEGVSRAFGPVKAVTEVTFTVEKGTLFGLVGSDGAGKSTLLRLVAAMVAPSEGRILIEGLDVMDQKERIKPLIGYMPQRFGLYQDLSVGENLDFFMDIFGLSGHERTKRRERYLGFSNLLPFVNRLAGELSGGMKQKLGLACVLVHHPRILILDEPTNGVDPVSRKEFWGILAEMKKEGMTILVSTAYLDEAERCDRIALMHKSRILRTATPAEIRGDFRDLEEAMIHRIQEVDEALLHDRFKL